MRRFAEFRHKEAVFRVATSRLDAVRSEIRRIRKELEDYIRLYPEFRESMNPLDSLQGAPPESVKRMHNASILTGVGPMAAVAGTVAMLAAEAAGKAGCDDTIINNGGDLFLNIREEAVIGLYGGNHALTGKAAFLVLPETTPLAICSSSSRMGHSKSFGGCDLTTVISRDGALADAAATLAGNLSIDSYSAAEAAERIAAIEGIDGIIILVGTTVAQAGVLPPLIPAAEEKSVREGILYHPDYHSPV